MSPNSSEQLQMVKNLGSRNITEFTLEESSLCEVESVAASRASEGIGKTVSWRYVCVQLHCTYGNMINSDFYRSMWRSRQRYSSAFRRWWNLLEFVLTVNSGCSWKECRQSSTSYSDFSRWRGKVKSIAYLQSSTAHFTWLRRLRIWLNLFWHWEVCMRWRQRMGSP